MRAIDLPNAHGLYERLETVRENIKLIDISSIPLTINVSGGQQISLSDVARKAMLDALLKVMNLRCVAILDELRGLGVDVDGL